MAEKQLQKGGAADIISSLENVFKQAPKLPENVQETLVSIAPWIALIFGILNILVGVGAFVGSIGLSALALFGGAQAGIIVFVIGVISVVTGALMLMAYPKLKTRQYKGWELLFWADMVSAVTFVLSIFGGSIDLGSIIGVLIGLYLLFQIKGHYK
jgi:hypothetical protein